MTRMDEALRIVEIVFPTDTNSQGSLFARKFCVCAG